MTVRKMGVARRLRSRVFLARLSLAGEWAGRPGRVPAARRRLPRAAPSSSRHARFRRIVHADQGEMNQALPCVERALGGR